MKVQGLLWHWAWEVSEQDKRHHTSSLAAALQPRPGWHHRWGDLLNQVTLSCSSPTAFLSVPHCLVLVFCSENWWGLPDRSFPAKKTVGICQWWDVHSGCGQSETGLRLLLLLFLWFVWCLCIFFFLFMTYLFIFRRISWSLQHIWRVSTK